MADYIEFTAYSDFFIDQSNVPALASVLKKDRGVQDVDDDEFLSDELGFILDNNGNIVGFDDTLGKEIDTKFFELITPFVRPTSRIVIYHCPRRVLYGYEWNEVNGKIKFNIVKYDIVPKKDPQ